jgi:hypothetical protein
MSKDTKNKSKTSTIPSGFCGNTQSSDAQNLINERLKSFSYGSTSDLSCISLNQMEMDLVYEALNTTIALTRLMDRESSEWAIPKLLELKQRFERTP